MLVASCHVTRGPLPPRHRPLLSTAGTPSPFLASPTKTDFAMHFGRICVGTSTVFQSLSQAALPKQEVNQLGLWWGPPSEASWGSASWPSCWQALREGSKQALSALCRQSCPPHLPKGAPKARLAAAEPPSLHSSPPEGRSWPVPAHKCQFFHF